MPDDVPAGISFSQRAPVTCPECGHSFVFEVWLIIDASKRPDLVAAICDTTLHSVVCPKCGHAADEIDAPLLLYRPRAEPPILFSPARQTSDKQNQEYAGGLVGQLRASLGDAWQDGWLADGLPVVPAEMLPAALSEDPAAALRQMAENAQAELERLREEDPEAFRRVTEAVEGADNSQAGEDDDEDEYGGDAIPPAVAAAFESILAELREAGVTVDSPEALLTVLAERPELQARLEAALREAAPAGALPVPRGLEVLDGFIRASSWDGVTAHCGAAS